MRRSLRGALAAALVAAALVAPGCGGEGATRFSGDEPRVAGGGGALRYAIPEAPASLDPLAATATTDRAVTVQVFEPLVAVLRGPYGSATARHGLALGWRHSGDFRVWSFRLRPRVLFQDGTPFNASAVLANAERWRASPQGLALLPGLAAADAPRPDLARLIFARPLRDLPQRLQDPRLGLVSPSALGPRRGGVRRLARAERAGSGPFELVTRKAQDIAVARYRSWWGSRLGLGPALDQVVFSVVPGQFERVSQLRSGEVRVAAELNRASAESLSNDPLLTLLGAGSGHSLGLERSVRGIDSTRPEPLSDVWLALLDQVG
ncbi:MAG: ABC transporter substrate-binding protein [Actinomycetota bacterium]